MRRSPGSRPAVSAGLPGATAPTRGNEGNGCREVANAARLSGLIVGMIATPTQPRRAALESLTVLERTMSRYMASRVASDGEMPGPHLVPATIFIVNKAPSLRTVNSTLSPGLAVE